MRSEKLQLLGKTVRNLYFSLLPLANSRRKFIYKHNVFAACGKDLFWQPHKLPSDPKCIRIHDNVVVAADVTFINHDVLYLLINHMGKGPCKEHLECTEIMDNVFIGLGAKIMPGVTIGPNAIIGAGAIVTKDVAPGTVVAGVPARVVGSFDDVVNRQLEESKTIDVDDRFDERRIRQAWDAFDRKRRERK